jgi:hypothetical protein
MTTLEGRLNIHIFHRVNKRWPEVVSEEDALKRYEHRSQMTGAVGAIIALNAHLGPTYRADGSTWGDRSRVKFRKADFEVVIKCGKKSFDQFLSKLVGGVTSSTNKAKGAHKKVSCGFLVAAGICRGVEVPGSRTTSYWEINANSLARLVTGENWISPITGGCCNVQRHALLCSAPCWKCPHGATLCSLSSRLFHAAMLACLL